MTPKEYAALSSTDAQNTLETLACNLFKSARWKTEFAASMGVTRDTVTKWFAPGGKPPFWSVMVIGALVALDESDTKIKILKEASAILSE